MWTAHRSHYGRDDDPVLVWQADTRTMNPTVPQNVIDRHMADDPARAGAEWLAEFRTDIEFFIDREAVEACVTPDMRERPPLRNIAYRAFVDPSGGRADAFTMAIAHYEAAKETVVLDALREIRPPFAPEVIVAELSHLLKSYNVSAVQGDRYAGEWPVEQFAKFGVRYEPSAKPKSELYVDLLPYVNSRRIDLLDLPKPDRTAMLARTPHCPRR